MKRVNDRTKGIVKNTVMLYGLSFAKIAFPLVTLPYLTRVLSVDGYGVVAYVKGIMQYMQIVIDFGFMLSATKDVVLAKKEKKDIGIVAGEVLGAQAILALISLLFLSFLVFTIPLLRPYMLYTYIAYIPVLLSAFLFDYVFRGIEKMEVITIRFVLAKGIATFFTFVFVHDDADIYWIPALDILGTVLAIILVQHELKKNNIIIKGFSISSSIKKLKESFTYFISNMATTAFGAFNTVLIGIFLTAGDVAFWSICEQLIAGIEMLYNPIISGVYPEMIKSRDINLIKKLLLLFMPIILAGCIFSIIVSKYVLLIVGGKHFVNAAPLFRMLVPVLFFCFPAMLFGWPTLGAIGKANNVTITTISAALFQVCGLLLLAFIGRFSLINIAIVRCATEVLLMLSRLGFCIKNKEEFFHEEG